MTELHPILQQIRPSDEQLPAVTARGSDVGVTAGAGTGKTRTLVARYLSLLVDGLPLRAVVAITFTRKAAREMRNRVRQEVRRYLERPHLPQAERRRWRGLYEQLDGARIGTIHSLCAEILRHHPAEMGVDPRFEMLPEGEMALLRAQAVDVALARAADDRDIVRLFDDLGERRLRRTVGQLLERRLDVDEARQALPADLWTVWEPHLTAPLRAFVEDPDVQNGFSELLSLRADGTLDRAEAAGDSLAPDLREALYHWDTIEAAHQTGEWADVSRHLRPLREVLKQKGRKANWTPHEPKVVIAELQERYEETLGTVLKSDTDLELDRRLAREIVPALLQLYDRALDHYTRAKDRRRALDFDDLESQALELLEEHVPVRTYWQEQIRALLVDEFQDTNARQRDILDLLSGGEGELFFVGDAKQSIYRFRGADVTVFRAEREAVDEHGVGLELSTSYRAHRALVESLNALLQPVLGSEDDPERPYVEPFAPLEHHREDPAPDLSPPYVEVHLAVGSKSGSALERAASALAARLAALVEEQGIRLEGISEEGGDTVERPLDFGDIAILCRASTSFEAYENALDEAGIPYLTIAGRGFYERPEVRDLLNALQAIAYPTDDLALAGLLRSPSLGLSDMALYRLRQAQHARGLPSLWSLLRQDELPVLDGEGERAAAACDLIDRLHTMAGRVRVADVLKAFLDETTYRAALLRAGQTRAASNADKLLNDAHASETVSASGFLAYVAELRDVETREGEARAIAAGAVQIMSVHQAKGLEFPVVVIGDIAKRTPSGGGVLIDPELGIVPPLREDRLTTTPDGAREVTTVSSAAHRLAQERDRDEIAAESERLLYVAATRAREMLLISGTVSAYKGGRIGTYGWLDRLDDCLHLSDEAPSCDGEGAAVHSFNLSAGAQPVRCLLYEPEAPLAPVTVSEPAATTPPAPPDETLLEPIGAARHQVDEAVRDAERDPPRRVWRVVPRTGRTWAPSWVVGKLVHLALEHWFFPQSDRIDFHRWAASEARSAGLTDESVIANAIQRAGRMMTRFQASSLCAEMVRAEQRFHEVPFSRIKAQGKLISGVIDALFRSDDQWTLVEFKTDRLADRVALENTLVAEDYVQQVAEYLDAAQDLLGQRPQAILCFLDCDGRICAVDDRW